MSNANGIRLLLVARLSRAKTSDRRDGVSIEIQDATAREWAEREGHAVIATAADIKSGTSAPWKRKNLKPWMEDTNRLAMYDALLIYRTDRISRGTQEDFTFIEHWAVSHGKRIIVADGPQFPKRDDSDYWRWTAEKDAARKEWEAIRTPPLPVCPEGPRRPQEACRGHEKRPPIPCDLTCDTFGGLEGEWLVDPQVVVSCRADLRTNPGW